MTIARSRVATLTVRADVAELVDAHGSGPCGLRLVEVQVLSSASASRAGSPGSLALTGEPGFPPRKNGPRQRRGPVSRAGGLRPSADPARRIVAALESAQDLRATRICTRKSHGGG